MTFYTVLETLKSYSVFCCQCKCLAPYMYFLIDVALPWSGKYLLKESLQLPLYLQVELL